MAEENQQQQMPENIINSDLKYENNQPKEIPTITTFIRQEIPQVKQEEEKENHNKETKNIKFWLIFLCIVFTCSMLSGVYLIINPPTQIKETVEERENIDDQIGNIKVNLGNIELNITRSTIRRLAVIFASILLVPLFLVFIIVGQFVLPTEQDKANSLATNIESINKQIKELTEAGQQTHFDNKIRRFA